VRNDAPSWGTSIDVQRLNQILGRITADDGSPPIKRRVLIRQSPHRCAGCALLILRIGALPVCHPRIFGAREQSRTL
jgi:hypothetical protein